ncbi:asparagine synthase C-terminal domain-containing protein [Dyadobacter pollutisoli]|uniref:asparagine synthase C-terminal domain-containing protein n=1 Tax=Dyadobacter pollutisoli TaxID=2910158 RepID=UPI00286EA9CD|nr:asparagine synthase C-terminal domain-containing protein [Dyadobacter pollutisoli]
MLDHLTINTKRIIRYLTFRADSLVDYDSETFFCQINSVLPAHQIIVTPSDIITKSWVDFNPDQWSQLTSLTEFANVFQNLFHNSVANSVNGDIVGSHLSGGMDSSSISSFARKLFPLKEFHTFYGAPNTQFASENEYAQAVADHIGSIHHEIAPQHNDFDLLTKYTSIYGHPETMILSPALQGSLLEAAHSHRCTTLLIGHDGDSIVGNGFDYLIELFRKRKWAELKELLAQRTQNPSFLRLFKNWNTLDEDEKLQAVYHDFFGRRFQEVAVTASIKELFTLFTDVKRNFNISTLHFLKRGLNSIIHKFLDKPIPNSLVKASARNSNREKSKLNKTLSESLSKNLEEKYMHSFSSVYNAQSITINEEFFALGNHYNMQASLPFFNKELFELCMSVPSKLKLGDGIGRQHFREAMKGSLPEQVRTRRDKAVFGSYGRLAARRLFRDAEGLLQNEENQVWDFIDKVEFNKIVKILHDDNQKPLTYAISQFHILRTISLAVWFDWLVSLNFKNETKKNSKP